MVYVLLLKVLKDHTTMLKSVSQALGKERIFKIAKRSNKSCYHVLYKTQKKYIVGMIMKKSKKCMTP